jgi:hypothetical protein
MRRGIVQLVVLTASLAGLFVPAVVSAATATANTTINATIAATISISSSSTVAIGLVPTSGGVVSSASDTITVSTNNTLGYILTLADTDTNNKLVSGTNNINAHAGTQGAPTALAANTWGYRVVNVGGFGATAYTAETNNASSTSTWAGMPTSAAPVTLKTTATTAASDITTVWYGVKATTSQPNGIYTDTVTYTATTN